MEQIDRRRRAQRRRRRRRRRADRRRGPPAAESRRHAVSPPPTDHRLTAWPSPLCSGDECISDCGPSCSAAAAAAAAAATSDARWPPGQVNAALRVTITSALPRLSVGYYIQPTEASHGHSSKCWKIVYDRPVEDILSNYGRSM